MKYLMVVLALVASAVTVQAENLSERITATSPWPEYGGKCAPLLQGELKDILPRDTQASVSFSGHWESGTLLAGEPVAYRIEQKCANGEWRCLLRILRCGNPANGRYWHGYPKPVKDSPVMVTRTNAVTVEKTVQVVEYRDRVEEVEKPAPPQYFSPPGIAPLWVPALPVNPGSRNVREWQTRSSGSVARVPAHACKDKTCGPMPPGGVPSPGTVDAARR